MLSNIWIEESAVSTVKLVYENIIFATIVQNKFCFNVIGVPHYIYKDRKKK